MGPEPSSKGRLEIAGTRGFLALPVTLGSVCRAWSVTRPELDHCWGADTGTSRGPVLSAATWLCRNHPRGSEQSGPELPAPTPASGSFGLSSLLQNLPGDACPEGPALGITHRRGPGTPHSGDTGSAPGRGESGWLHPRNVGAAAGLVLRCWAGRWGGLWLRGPEVFSSSAQLSLPSKHLAPGFAPGASPPAPRWPCSPQVAARCASTQGVTRRLAQPAPPSVQTALPAAG